MCATLFGPGVGGGGRGRRAFWLAVAGRRSALRFFVGAQPGGFPYGCVILEACLPGCQGVVILGAALVARGRFFPVR